MRLMVGELNASHLGVSNPFGSAVTNTGRLGLDFDRAEYEQSGRLRVSDVVPLGPAALARDSSAADRTRPIKVGEYLLAVDGRTLDARTNLDELLNYKTGRRVTLDRLGVGRRRGATRGGRASGQHGDREGVALQEVGRGAARVRRAREQWSARLRPHVSTCLRRRSRSSTWIWTRRTSRKRAWSWTCDTTTAASSTSTPSTCWRARAICG